MNASFPLYMDADAEPGEGVEDEGWAKDGQQEGKLSTKEYSWLTAANWILKITSGVSLYFQNFPNS